MLKYIIIAAIAVIFLIPAAICFIRVRKFKPNPNKLEQLTLLNDDIKSAGFAYCPSGDYFYSLRDCWQRDAGYCRLYDEGSPFFNMVMDCEPVEFVYKGKRWLIELWKGQYGITTGAEIGVYNTDRPDVETEKFTGSFYDAAGCNEQLDISFVLYKDGKKLLKRSDRHWWLTAFRLGEFSEPKSLVMRAKIKFPDREMLSAFTESLVGIGYTQKEFYVRYKTVYIEFAFAHSSQPLSQTGLQKQTAQHMNKTNCGFYKSVTAKYSDTLDKLEYMRSFAPEVYDFMLRSMYGKEFFRSFEWLIKLIHGDRPKPPCEPEPPCKPEPPCECECECEPEPPCECECECEPEPPCCDCCCDYGDF